MRRRMMAALVLALCLWPVLMVGCAKRKVLAVGGWLVNLKSSNAGLKSRWPFGEFGAASQGLGVGLSSMARTSK